MARSPRPRPPLSRERVLRAGASFADEHGLDALSMRKLARSLGFEVMSLYNHVTGKDDLIEGMLDVVAGEIEPARGDLPWTESVRRHARSTHDVLVRHRWAAGEWAARPVGPARMRLIESLLAVLQAAGLGRDLGHHAFHAVSNYVVGFTMQELSLDLGPDAMQQGAARFMESLPAQEFPLLREHVLQHLAGIGEEDEFDFGLDLILDGLDRMRAAG